MYVFSWNEMFTQPSHFRARNLHVITNVTLKLATSKCNCRYVIINIDIISNHYVKQWCQSRNRLRDARAIPIHTRGTKRFIPVMNKDERHTHEKYQRQIVPSWLDNMMMIEQTGEWHAANWIFELFMLKYIWRFSSKVNELNFQMFLWPYDFIILTELLIIKKQFDGFDASYFPRHKSRSTQGKGTVKLMQEMHNIWKI